MAAFRYIDVAFNNVNGNFITGESNRGTGYEYVLLQSVVLLD